MLSRKYLLYNPIVDLNICGANYKLNKFINERGTATCQGQGIYCLKGLSSTFLS